MARRAEVRPARVLNMAFSWVLMATHSNPSFPACFDTTKFCGTTTICPSRILSLNTDCPLLSTICIWASPLVA
ncbi:hypothetical protein RHMOL_Rhmol01G0350300 [Rhododendron molle]|uniref:Uncharacterized protein n=1 Tax=Rhododendron molle TaxID=49168 RepID=A0ACC0Q8Q5_RHOML|nr:hypothetical protein RHMOL_Rhmol01G0350300 [Rhododendron molle]